MSSLVAKHKKGTVIHRTTSETLRLGDEILSPQIRVSTRKKSQTTSPSCSFQITGVLTRYDQEDESADDLDESHTDEISRVTDNETPSFSEDSRDEPGQTLFQAFSKPIDSSTSPAKTEVKYDIKPPPTTTTTNINNNNNDLGRFRVVKLGSMIPFSRGRWTCYDYEDESSDTSKSTTNNSSSSGGGDNPASSKSYSCQSTYLYTGSIFLNHTIPVYVPITERPISTSNNYILPKTRVSFISNSKLDSNQNDQRFSNNLNVIVPVNNNAGTSVACTSTIDTKIEHALDVVKNHLTHAVRVEVEELKVKINELAQRITYLEYENDLLRSSVTPEVLANLDNRET